MVSKVKRKLCRSCRRRKPIGEFHKDPSRLGGRYPQCKFCYNGSRQKKYDPVKSARRYKETGSWQRIKREYGMSPEQYKELWNKQRGLCALNCGRAATCIDHDHQTEEVRGLLCRRCNSALGAFGDNEAGLLRVLEYVRRMVILAPR